jgi:Peptidase family S41
MLATAPALGDVANFDVNPWIDDLHEIRTAMSEKYANFEWAVFEREIDLSGLFDETEARLRHATSDEDAKAMIDRSIRSIGDGHLRLRWPSQPTGVSASAPAPQQNLCSAPRYDASLRGRALGPYIPNYHPLPELCADTRDRLEIPADSSCDEKCTDRLESAEYEVMSRDLALRVKELKRLGSTVLLIDITGNGGGSEWAEAAARIVSPFGLRSERREGVRGEHWADYWESLAKELRQAAHSASPADSQKLEEWALQAEQARANASTHCSSAPFWSGHRPDCEWLAPAFYATGLLAEADATILRKKPWGPSVFSAAKYDFEASVWRGPLLVLVDGGTGSAAAEFSSVLQDNKAAVIIGAPGPSGGCGHTRGGTPTTLTHSHAILELPDCARIRRDGSNEARGIDPNILIGFRGTDGIHRKGQLVNAALSRSAAAAVQLCVREHCSRKQ